MDANQTTTDDSKQNNRVCPHTIAFFLNNPLRRIIQNPRKIVGPYIKPGDTVIDLGCGPGFFTIDMAQIVGATGQVIAVDLQPQMLTHVNRKALKKGVSDRITLHRCGPDSLELTAKADFILAFYMVHETPDPANFLNEVRALLKEGGLFLVIEPRFHVKGPEFEAMVNLASQTGFEIVDRPRKKGGHSALLS